MNKQSQTLLLGIFAEVEAVGQATESLREAHLATTEYQVLSGAPYPEAAFGGAPVRHRLYVFPLMGAILGFAVGLLLTVWTQLANPVMTGGKPILAIPPMGIVTYESTMLGAIVFTILGIVFESRLLRRRPLYDQRITEGYLGVLVSCQTDQTSQVEGLLREAGAVDIKRA